MISKALDYAIRSIVYLASVEDREYCGVAEIADRVQVSKSYLGKILQGLVHAGFLRSSTGPGGGFALAKPPQEITLYEVLVNVDGDRLEETCVLGIAHCSDENPCPVHNVWTRSRRDLISAMKRMTVARAMKQSWPDYR